MGVPRVSLLATTLLLVAVVSADFFGDTREPEVVRALRHSRVAVPITNIVDELEQKQALELGPTIGQLLPYLHDHSRNTSFDYPSIPAPTHMTRDTTVGIDSPSIIPWGPTQDGGYKGSTYIARRYVINSLDTDESSMILYPYSFDALAEDKLATIKAKNATNGQSGIIMAEQSFPYGSLLDTEPTENLPSINDYYFHWLLTNSTINLSRAKAVYDSSIAVLQVTDTWIDGVPIDLTWEADYFCTVFYNYIWGKYKKCFRGLYDWEQYLAANPVTHERVSFVFLTPENITANGLKNTDGSNRFGMLIFPDIVEGSQSKILSRLSSASSQIQSFVSAGGLLYSSGKGALVVEGLSLARSGTFSQSYTLTSTASILALGDGCKLGDFSSDVGMDFIQRTICFSIPRGTDYIYDALLSGPKVDTMDTSYTVFANWKTGVSWRPIMLHDTVSGLNSDLPADGTTQPMIMYKKYGQGQVLLNLGNSPYEWNSFSWVYNAFLLANTKPVVLNNKIDGAVNHTIPALETVTLSSTLTLKNYFSGDIGQVSFSVFYRKGLDVQTTTPSLCTVKTTSVTVPLDILNNTRWFDCTLTSLAAFATRELKFSISIIDNLITQQKLAVTLLYPKLSYTDAASKQEEVEYAVTVDAAMAALLRADMNIDPSSTYPLHARGAYVDNVMNCENKEETVAQHVSHVSIVPLITPLIDINDQIQLASYMEFDMEYYKQATNQILNYIFPFVAEEDYDYMDFTRLCSRNNVLAASWDEAVKLFRIARDTVSGAGKDAGITPAECVPNANYQTNNENDFYLEKQQNFANSDSYYEHATQRMMAFLDTWDPKGAATFYHNSIPASDQAPSKAGAARRRVLFARNDVFFWTKYPQPDGLPDRNTLITVDQYTAPTCTGNGFQSTSTYTVKGVFSSADPTGVGLIPQEWQNELLLDCRRAAAKVTPDQLESKSGGLAKLTHYIVPISDDGIQQAADMYGFDTSGTYFGYSEIKFVYPYQAKIDVYPSASRRGGEMVFTFSTDPWNGVNPTNDDWVTVSADQIAIISITYSAPVLRIRFKRGNMPNEAYGSASHLQINLEGITASETTVSCTMDLYSLVYDIADPAHGYERWYDLHTVSGQAVQFTKTRALSLPAAVLSFVLPWTDSIMQPYEFLEPFVRYGLYEQELYKHRAVHGSAEIHPINEPCLVTRNGGFSTFTHVGTSSVPFREYVNTGISLIIPAAAQTGRVEWYDVWGRHWAQPVRSTIFEYPPIPPPLRNFVMTTTFELLSPSSTGLQFTDWRSDDTVDVRVQMKLLNNYPKYFEITTCKENEVMELCTGGNNCGYSRLFDIDFAPPTDFKVPTDTTDDLQYIKIGHNASYGICFRDAEVWLNGTHLTADDRALIQHAAHCANIIDDDDPLCEQLMGEPTVSRRPDSATAYPWNYATQVAKYWPQGYAKNIMWDLTHYDYDDTKYDKAYKYHMDNNLPHLGHYITKTDNIIAFPLFKGCGYKMVYANTHGNPKFPGKTGWWSDNLQNRDHTLVAGQQFCHNISVNAASLIDSSEWVDITQLTNAASESAAALKNIYTCLFNRKRLKTYVDNQWTQYLTNVYENNVIPVPPGLTANDVTNYDCTGTTQYTPDNINQFPNVVYTDSPRDWLYFAANLRGNALETINVIYQLKPLDTNVIKYEGVAKVQDGGRFTYWNPANSRNSFLVHDNPVSTVFAIRNDLQNTLEIIPTYTTTFDALVFQHLTITDEEEDHREWTTPIYIKHHGYGDFVISVYVGGNGGSAILEPGGQVRVKITFSNNAGFDINLKSNAMESSEIDQEAINSNDLMYNLKHTLMYPSKYNFMDLVIPEDLKPYITYEPCQDVVGIAPLFFDFDNINVATIRDGWKGDYYYWLHLSSSFPVEKRGRLLTIPMKLNTTYFDFFPGSGDPTKMHSYAPVIPSLVIGVPYASSHPDYPNKIFWTSGYATFAALDHCIPNTFTPEGAQFVTLADLDRLRQCLSSGSGEVACLETAWKDFVANGTACPFTSTVDSYNNLHLDYTPGLTVQYPTFPKKVLPTAGPDVAELHILLKTTAKQLSAGYPAVSYYRYVRFQDWTKASKSVTDDLDYDVHSKGAWLSVSYKGTLVSATGLQLSSQYLYTTDNGNALITITVRNSGDGMAYSPNMTVYIPTNITILEGTIKANHTLKTLPGGTSQELTFYMGVPLAPGSSQAYTVQVQFYADGRDGAGPGASGYLGGQVIASGGQGAIDLTETQGERQVKQNITNPFILPYSSNARPDMTAWLSGKKSSGSQAQLEVSHEIEQIRNYLWRCRAPDTRWITFAITTGEDSTGISVDIDALWENITSTSTTAYKKVTIDFMVSLTRDAAVTVASTPVVVAESNIWQWNVPENNYLWLLFLIPGAAIPALALTVVFLKVPGKKATPPEPVYNASSSSPSKVPKAKRYQPDDDVEMAAASGGASGTSAQTPVSSSGPTYLMAGCTPINVVDTKAL
ncbi:hypothetical protein Pelo_16786 [Pelomyxa schiedti]|nr:hypothetical protein Pelo_16786 [Pelomyxa schiedti]